VLRPERFVRGEPPILYRFLWPSTPSFHFFEDAVTRQNCVDDSGPRIIRAAEKSTSTNFEIGMRTSSIDLASGRDQPYTGKVSLADLQHAFKPGVEYALRVLNDFRINAHGALL
jgi:hypothetical protein